MIDKDALNFKSAASGHNVNLAASPLETAG